MWKGRVEDLTRRQKIIVSKHWNLLSRSAIGLDTEKQEGSRQIALLLLCIKEKSYLPGQLTR